MGRDPCRGSGDAPGDTPCGRRGATATSGAALRQEITAGRWELRIWMLGLMALLITAWVLARLHIG